MLFRVINVINTDIYFSLSLSQKKVYKPYISLIIQGKVTCNVYNAIYHIYVIFIWNIIQQNLVDYFVCLLSLLSCWILISGKLSFVLIANKYRKSERKESIN